MYPSWGNYGGGHPPPTNVNVNQFDARSAPVRAPPPTAGAPAGYGAPPPASNFNSLREQHLQQMQQLQQLHQKQLQSVLHYSNAPGYGGPGGWQGQGAAPGFPPPGSEATTNYQQGPPGSVPPQPPQPPQPQEEAPPKPPEPTPPTTQQNYTAPGAHTSNNENNAPKDLSAIAFPQEGENPDFTSMTLQDQQQFWYKQHLQNLQKLKNERAKQGQSQGQPADKNQKPGEAPPPPVEPPKNAPPPPLPKEEPPPPPPPEEPKTNIASSGDPFEAARMQQLQAAAAQWQQAQQQRAAHQYQALMHEHAQLQQILQQYQQFIQQPAHLQTMSLDMQLKHYDVQQQQFTPVYQEWDRHFKLWYEQFQSYPHKDQLQDYEAQWKQWQEQMNSTAAHLQERVTTLRAMQQQYGPPPGYGGMGGQYGQNMPPPDSQMHHPSLPPNASMQHSPSVGPPSSGPPPTGTPLTGASPAGPPTTGPTPAGQPASTTASQAGVSTATTTSTPTSESYQTTATGNMSAPYGNNNAGPQHPGMRPTGPRFDGPRFDQSQHQRFNAPPRFDPRQRFNAPNQGPPGRFDSPMRHGAPGFERPPGPNSRFERPPGPSQNPQNRFESPQGPPQNPQNRFERPPGPPQNQQSRFERPPGPGQGPMSRFERPPGPGQGPMSRFEPGPGQGPMSRFERPPGPGQGPASRFERPPGPGQGPASRFERPPGPGQGPASRFGRPPGPGQGPASRFERPPGPGQGPASRFDRPPAPQPQQAGVGSQVKPNSAAQTKEEKQEITGSQSKESTSENKGAKEKSTVDDTLAEDIVDSGNGFFVQNDPIPQTSQKDTPQKAEDPVAGAKDKAKDVKETETSKTAVSAPSSTPLKQTPTPPGQAPGPAKSGVNNGPPPRPMPHEMPRQPPPGPPHGDNQMGHPSMGRGQHPPGPPYGDHPMGPPHGDHPMGPPHGDHPMGPPHMMRGRGRGQMPMPMRGRGRARGRGMPGGPMGPPHGYDPNFQPPEEEEHSGYEYEAPQEHMGHTGEEEVDYGWEDPSAEPSGRIPGRGPPHHEQDMWLPEEHHFGEEYYEEAEGQEEAVEEEAKHWQEAAEPEAEPEYWEQEQDPYGPWNVRRPPMRGRPPFPHGMRGRPPPPRGFMHQGPRRPPPPHPPHMEGMEHEPYGPPQGYRGHPRGPMGPPMHRGLPPRGHPALRGMMKPRPPPPREMMERDPHGPPPYHDPMEHDPEWAPPPPPHGREPRRLPPPPPHAMMERDLRRPPAPPPYGPGPPRRRPPFPHEDPEGLYEEPYEEEYPPPDDGYRRPPPPPREFITRDYEHGQEGYYPPPPPKDWEMERGGREYPPYTPHGPPERMREDRWSEGRERPYPYEEEHGRPDYEGPGYPDEPPYGGREPPYRGQPDWEKPLPERSYPPIEPRRPSFEAGSESGMDIPPQPPQAGSDPSHEQASPTTAKGVLALSQRQHEIILKAAQELKMIRELQECKGPAGDTAAPEVKTELLPGLLGLEIPPEVKSALQSTGLLSETGQAGGGKSVSWEYDHPPQEGGYHQQPPPSKPIITKTVDYGHGHESGATVERMSYGERIILRPDPLPERTFEKEPLGPREPYGPRDPYFDRRNDPYMERREWSRERERDPYREREREERERFERDRFARDDRPPSGPPGRPGYRDREREQREREGRSSRDREPYGRPPYDRPPYERGTERFEHGPPGPPGYGNDRRSYPDERPPGPQSSMAPAPGPPPRAEKKPETKNVDDLLKPPGRSSRPDRIVIIMRGLSGSGKSHVAKLVRDKEVECGGAPPRVLSIDDYFMTEVEKVEKDPESGKNVKNKVLEYEYEPEMEDTYRSSMLKTFKKTLDDGFFPFIIIDAINDKVKYFDQFWSAAKTKGFEVYVAEITADNQTCAKRNIHGRKTKDISKMASSWETTPRHMVRLDIRSLLQDAAIEEVEMEDFDPSKEELKTEMKKEDEEETDLGFLPKSKWEIDTSEAKLDKLDGLVGGSKRKRESDVAGIEDFLQLPDDYATRMSEPGKKRVRWADLEEKKDADRKRAIGFVVGQTDWEKITDETGQLAQRALNRTKYF
ncbi:YLP motif-containing protein 1 isoform X2 [Sardina pilchardus]|uniref:YLP motif-containing protein 1 isoform X2 n=1 Tax=Sardina pilchardus TaxID=27697 RepID=UPI002E129529